MKKTGYLRKGIIMPNLISIAKIMIVMLILSPISLLANSEIQQKKDSPLKVENMTLEKIIDLIEENSSYKFLYNKQVINAKETYTTTIDVSNINKTLKRMFDGKDIAYKIEDMQIALSTKALAEQSLLGDKKKIGGVIKDSGGLPIIGAVVRMANNSSIGNITDADGKFTLTVPVNATLEVSFIGYTPTSFKVEESKIDYNITLLENAEQLGEVVVTALGIKRDEKALGYAVQKVDGETLSTVKGVSVATSLTGKIAGVNVRNSTEFGTEPSILVRGKSPLMVIDGVPFQHMSLADIAADDIEEITVLKGPGASALYGARGGVGAIMVTTKRGAKEGLSIAVNSNTMFNAGHISIPKPQTSYSTGNNGVYDRNDFVWGDKMDIGRTAIQYDPYTYEWREMLLVSKGKDNFKNFLETAMVTNNNVSVAYKTKGGSIRTSLNHVYNKGQYPNLKSNKFNYSVSGEFEVDKFKFDGGITMSHYYNPQSRGAGYGATGYVYNFLVWTGTDFDVRDFKNYWQKGKEEEKQNWWNPGWYDNPYFLANARTSSDYRNKTNSHFSATYSATDWLKTIARVGHDIYSNRSETRTPLDTRGNAKGAYSISNSRGFSLNADFIAMTEHKISDFSINSLWGGGIFFFENDGHSSSTSNGLSIPGFYSLNASVDPVMASSSVKKRQANSIFGQLNFNWKSIAFLDLSGRNDWVSTLEESERSYFYPGISSSFIASEILPLPDWLKYWKFRGSWSLTKNPADPYDINQEYTISKNLWNNMNGATFPTSMRDKAIKPASKSSWEIGTELYFLNNRLRFDIGYYQENSYNLQRNATVSNATGFSNILVNYGEEQLRKGVEITLEGDIVKTKDFEWVSTFNWSLDRYYYNKVDDKYSTDRPWVAAGERWDWMGGVYDWERDPDGNIVHHNGKPRKMQYERNGFNEHPDWIWGFNNRFKYKDFTLSFSFDGRVGGYGYDQTEQAMWNSGTHPDSDNQWRYDQVVNGKTNYIGEGVKVVSGDVKYDKYGTIVEDTRVFAPNDVAIGYQEYIQAYQSWSGNKNIQNIKKMTFFKLRELAIGYTVPKKYAQYMKLNDLSVSFVGQNLLIWSPNFKHSDPDIHSNALNSPSVRYVGCNVKFSF